MFGIRRLKSYLEPLLLERYYAELHIYEIGFSQSSHFFTEQPNLRFECLFACLQATKSFCDTLVSMEAHQYLGLSALASAEMTSYLTSVCRLSMCEYPGWDRDIVHSTMNVSAFLEELEKNFARVREVIGIDPDEPHGGRDYFTMKASKLHSMKETWDALTLPAISLEELESFPVDFMDAWSWCIK